MMTVANEMEEVGVLLPPMLSLLNVGRACQYFCLAQDGGDVSYFYSQSQHDGPPRRGPEATTNAFAGRGRPSSAEAARQVYFSYDKALRDGEM